MVVTNLQRCISFGGGPRYLCRVTVGRGPSLLTLLGSRGLRELERTRADQQSASLRRLLELMGQPNPSPHAVAVATTSSVMPLRMPSNEPLAGGDEHDTAENDHRLFRFREPPPEVPHGWGSSVRLVAVAPGQLFCSWHMAHGQGAAGLLTIVLVRAPHGYDDDNNDSPSTVIEQTIELGGGRMYLPVMLGRGWVEARVRDHHGDEWVSNRAWLVPDAVAEPGPLWWAEVPVTVDRRTLVGGGVLRGAAGVRLRHAGTVQASAHSWRGTSSSAAWARAAAHVGVAAGDDMPSSRPRREPT
jgi:hypothetical protein